MSVQDELDRAAREGRAHAVQHSPDYQELWAALTRATVGGKRLRPSLLQAAYLSYGGRDTDLAARVAAGVELLHTAFVIHDDVIDRDLVRRGATNVSGCFVERGADRGADADGAQMLGVAAGVLAGDLALVGAIREIALCGASPDVTRRLLDLLDAAVKTSAAGELDDVVLSVCRPAGASLGDVITVLERKTAVYSFQLPLQLGAVLAGASESAVERLAVVGRLAGIGFQLVDDLRGVFGEEEQTGKSALGDLREGKLTALIAHARGTDAWELIAPHFGDPDLDLDRALTVRTLLEECGSRRLVESLADGYLTMALQAARDLELDPALLAELSRLTHRILRSAA